MQPAPALPTVDRATASAFHELALMDELSRLPVAAVLRVLRTIPAVVLAAALDEARD